MNAAQKVVRLSFQQLIIGESAGRNHFRYTPLYHPFRRFGIFQLVAHCHPVTGFHQFVQVGIECMMRETGQFGGMGYAVVAFGERNAEHLRCDDGIFPEGFIKIAHPEQHHRRIGAAF